MHGDTPRRCLAGEAQDQGADRMVGGLSRCFGTQVGVSRRLSRLRCQRRIVSGRTNRRSCRSCRRGQCGRCPRTWACRPGEVVLNEPVSSFGTTGVSPEVENELTTLMSLRREPIAVPRCPHTRSGPSPSFPRRQQARSPAQRSRGPGPPCGHGGQLSSGGRRFQPCLDLQRQSGRGWTTEFRRHGTGRRRSAAPLPLVVDIANAVDGVIVSNDNFAPLQPADPWLRTSGRMLGATLSQGFWVFSSRVPPLNSCGRYKP